MNYIYRHNYDFDQLLYYHWTAAAAAAAAATADC